MKKNLLLTGIILAFGATATQAQMHVKADTDVKVQPNTLVYSTGDFTIEDYSASHTQKFSNEGNVKIDGNFTSGDTSDGSVFVNEHTSETAYGQLIINQASTVTGKIVHEWDLPSNFDFLPMALPFQNYQGDDLGAALGRTFYGNANCGSYPCGSRYISTLFFFNNAATSAAEVYQDHVKSDMTGASTGDALQPYHFVLLNNASGNFTGVTAGGVESIFGTPSNAAATVALGTYSIPGFNAVNAKGETFASFIDDPVIDRNTWTATNNPQNYGNNIFQFSNPYNSNIDLSYIGVGESAVSYDSDGMNFGDNVEAVYSYNTVTYGADGTTGALDFSQAAFNTSGEFMSGDINLLLVKPYGHFLVKFADSFTGDNFVFSDALKTFDNSPRANNDVDGDGASPRPAVGARSSSNGIYELKLETFDANGDYLNNRVYITASDIYQPLNDASFGTAENFYISFGNRNGIYTLQENADGTINQRLSNQKVYINGINAHDYVALPVTVGLNLNNSNPANNITIKGSLKENVTSVPQLSNGNKFYFHDKVTDEIFEVDSEFEYTFTATESDNDRFAVYWNGLPETLSVDNPISLQSSTIVYKDVNDFKVRFNKEWGTADVYVYNIAGQLVHTAKNVTTDVDYLLPLSSKVSTAYIVKTVSKEGEVVTKKIVK